MNAIELGCDAGTEKTPSEYPCMIRNGHVLKFAPTGKYMSIGRGDEGSEDIVFHKDPKPLSTKIVAFGGNIERKVEIMARVAQFHVSELEDDEINVLIGGVHVAPATKIGRARRPARMDYRTRKKLPKLRGIRWLMDTGCGFDLAKKAHLVRCGLEKHILSQVLTFLLTLLLVLRKSPARHVSTFLVEMKKFLLLCLIPHLMCFP